MAFELKMPKLGESVTEGTIGKWLKQPGDKVNKYDLLVEVQTDKVNTEIPSPVAGTLKEVKVEEGQTVPIGTLLAVFDTADGEAAAQPSVPAAPKPAQATTQPESSRAQTPAAAPETSQPAGGPPAPGRAPSEQGPPGPPPQQARESATPERAAPPPPPSPSPASQSSPR